MSFNSGAYFGSHSTVGQCARSARAAQGTSYRIRWPTQANLLR